MFYYVCSCWLFFVRGSPPGPPRRVLHCEILRRCRRNDQWVGATDRSLALGTFSPRPPGRLPGLTAGCCNKGLCNDVAWQSGHTTVVLQVSPAPILHCWNSNRRICCFYQYVIVIKAVQQLNNLLQIADKLPWCFLNLNLNPFHRHRTSLSLDILSDSWQGNWPG